MRKELVIIILALIEVASTLDAGVMVETNAASPIATIEAMGIATMAVEVTMIGEGREVGAGKMVTTISWQKLFVVNVNNELPRVATMLLECLQRRTVLQIEVMAQGTAHMTTDPAECHHKQTKLLLLLHLHYAKRPQKSFL